MRQEKRVRKNKQQMGQIENKYKGDRYKPNYINNCIEYKLCEYSN